MLAALVGAIGAQTFFGGFLLAIIAGHEAQFMPAAREAEFLALSQAA